MYLIESNLKVRQRPETIVGSYGYLSEVLLPTDSPVGLKLIDRFIEQYAEPADSFKADQHFDVIGIGSRKLLESTVFLERQREGHLVTALGFGSKMLVENRLHRLAGKGLISKDAMPIKITSPEEAERFITDRTRTLRFKHTAKPNNLQMAEAIEKACDKKGQRIVQATAELWREKRFPSSLLYVLGHGTLEEAIAFDEELGWHKPDAFVWGQRQVKGLGSGTAGVTKSTGLRLSFKSGLQEGPFPLTFAIPREDAELCIQKYRKQTAAYLRSGGIQPFLR